MCRMGKGVVVVMVLVFTCGFAACRGSADDAMPNVVGQERAEAVAALEELELNVTVEEQPSAEERGTVITQAPAAGEPFPQDDNVTITVASAPVPTEELPVGDGKVPDVVGLLRPAAEALLQEQSIPLGIVTPERSNLPDGTVVSQQPTAGQPVPAGGVNLAVAESATVPVPTLIGRADAEARTEIERVGLQVGTVETALEGAGAIGRVIEQSPDPGFMAPRGSPIRIVVKEAGVRVPRVIGQTIGGAGSTLVNSGLSFNTRWVVDRNREPGTIVALDPPPDSMVPRGSGVALTATTRGLGVVDKLKARDHLISDALKLKTKPK